MTHIRPTEQSFSDLVAAIYDAAVSPEQWPVAMALMRAMFGLSFVASVTRSADRRHVEGLAVGVEESDYQTYLRTHFPGSLFGRRPERAEAGLIVAARDLVPPAEFHRSPMYQEYWRPRDLHEALHLGLSLDRAGTYHYMSLVRPRSGDAYQAEDFLLARRLMPHLRRASELARRLRHADLLAGAGLAALETVTHGIVLLDRDGLILHANTTAGLMLARADGLSRDRGRLAAANQAWTARLQAAVWRAGRDEDGTARAEALRLPQPSTGAGLAVLVVPFRQDAHWSLADRPAVLVCVSDLSQTTVLPAQHLTALFGLTAKEADLAQDLLAGLDLREVAHRRGRSANTLRTHLASLMSKTSVNRQSDLMRLLARLPRSGDAER